MDEKQIKTLFRGWMYNWGYYPKKGYQMYFIKLNNILQRGKAMIPFYDQKDYKTGSRNYVMLDDLFELQINKKAESSPFIFGDNVPPKNIAFEYKGTQNGIRGIYTAIGQAMVYHCIVNQPTYLVIDIKDYLILENVFSVLPYGIICYRVKNINDGIKIFKHPNIPSI